MQIFAQCVFARCRGVRVGFDRRDIDAFELAGWPAHATHRIGDAAIAACRCRATAALQARFRIDAQRHRELRLPGLAVGFEQFVQSRRRGVLAVLGARARCVIVFDLEFRIQAVIAEEIRIRTRYRLTQADSRGTDSIEGC